MSADNKVLVDEWARCYGESWTGVIVPAAMGHPAKFSKALVRRIYDHVIDEGWLQPGQSVVDCFGGVALGAYEAMQRGMNWVAVELEPRFIYMGSGGDCPGFTKKQWKRFHHRLQKISIAGKGADRQKIDLCPDCVEAMDPGPVDPQVTLFGTHNRLIPFREPHHYTGNIEAWRTLNLPGEARLVRGDSRRLAEVLGFEKELAMTSPPYEQSVKMRSSHLDEERCLEKGLDPGKNGRAGHSLYGEQYGQSEGQVGNLAAPEGSLELTLSSPPYGHRTVHGQSGIDPSKFEERNRTGHSSQATTQDRYGDSEGQLANLAMSSPPFSDSVAVAPRANKLMSSVAQNHGNNKARQENCDLNDYGSEPGQLGQMKEGDPTLVISSPPYAGNSGKHDRTGAERAQRRHDRLGFKQGVGCFKTSEAYGEEEGQLGSMETGETPGVAITSPPYARSLMPDMNDPDKFEAQQARYRENHPEHKRPKNCAPVYGNTAGNLGHIPEGTIDAVISSPPYANQNITGRRNFIGGGGNEQPAAAAGRDRQDGYGETPGQIGAMAEGRLESMIHQSLEDARVKTPSEELLQRRQDEFRQWLDGSDIAITSPPYADSDTKPGALTCGAASRSDGSSGTRAKGDYEYGDAPGQLGRMPSGVISSPPYPQPHTGGGGINVRGYQNDALRPGSEEKPFDLVGQRTYQGRGGERAAGNLETLETGTVNSAISSPPYPQPHSRGGSINVEEHNEEWRKRDLQDLTERRTYQGRGGDRVGGNLETLDTGDIDAAITSPPYEHDSEPHGDLRPDEGRQEVVFVDRDYGATEGNVSASPETFWSASRVILEQLHQVLAPGAHAVFVCKAFVRNGVIVDFPGQWAMLCQAVGFKWLHDHHALLTEEYATQGGFEEDRTLSSSRKSFFRRLHEKKRPDLAIEWESVLCFVKE